MRHMLYIRIGDIALSPLSVKRYLVHRLLQAKAPIKTSSEDIYKLSDRELGDIVLTNGVKFSLDIEHNLLTLSWD